MSWYRRSSFQDRLEYGRRRSSAFCVQPISTPRRCSLAPTSTRLRSNSKVNAEIAALGEIHPEFDDLAKLIPGLPAGVTFDPVTIPPTPHEIPDDEKQEKNVRVEEEVLPSEDEIREALLQSKEESNCCSYFFKGAEVTIVKIDYQPRYRYKLESFSEKRELSWNFEPYTGEPLEEPLTDFPVEPWKLEYSSQQPMFQNSSTTSQVPHTDCLFACCICGGSGRKRCPICCSSGWERCSFCLGDGQKVALHGNKDRCHKCLGIGRKKCWRCLGEGMATCQGCGGTGQIKYFVVLTITRTNYVDSQITGATDTVWEVLQTASGKCIYAEEKHEMDPLENQPDDQLHAIAKMFLSRHTEDLHSEKLIARRQQVEVVPVSYVSYHSGANDVKQCLVYGTSNNVYSPRQHIRCCTVI